MSQLEAAAEVVRLQTLRTVAARNRAECAAAEQRDAIESLQREEGLLWTAKERLIEVAALADHQMAQTA